MKLILFAIFFFFLIKLSFSQVGVGTTTPSDKAMLEISSTSDSGTTYKGFLPPRVPTSTERDLINPSMADIGMTVFVLDSQCLQIWNGSSWEDIKCLSGPAGPSTEAIQDFEIFPATPTLGYLETGVGQLQAGVGSFPASNKFKSPDRGFGVQNGTSITTFDSFDASSNSSATVSFFLASFAGTSGNGADSNDNVSVEISVDNGSSFSEEILISGTGNAKWDFDATGTAIIVYDGDDIPTAFTSSNGSAGIATVQISGITNATDIIIRITMTNNSGNELWVIDDVKIEGI